MLLLLVLVAVVAAVLLPGLWLLLPLLMLLFVPTLLLSRQEARLQMLADTSPSVVYVTGKPTPWMPKEVPEGGASPGGTAWMSLVVSFAVEGSG